MKKILLIISWLTFMACSNDAMVEGRIVNEQNEPIEGVLVQVMGTDLYEVSDAEGNFKIDTKNRGEELIFNKDGYEFERKSLEQSREVQLKSKN